MKKLLLLILLPLLLAASCNKEQPENPLNNVVRCKINVVPWEAQCDGNIVFGCNAVDCILLQKEGGKYYLNLRAFRKNGTSLDDGLQFILYNYDTKIAKINPKDEVFGNNKLTEACKRFYMDTLKNNIFSMNIDTTTKGDRVGTITGIFSLSASNACGESINVTDGYFRTGYR